MATRTDQTTPLLPEIRELSDAEWERLVDDKARQRAQRGVGRWGHRWFRQVGATLLTAGAARATHRA